MQNKTSRRLILNQSVDTYDEAIKLRTEFIAEIEKYGLQFCSASLYSSVKYPPYDPNVKPGERDKAIGFQYSIRVEGADKPGMDDFDEMFP